MVWAAKAYTAQFKAMMISMGNSAKYPSSRMPPITWISGLDFSRGIALTVLVMPRCTLDNSLGCRMVLKYNRKLAHRLAHPNAPALKCWGLWQGSAQRGVGDY